MGILNQIGKSIKKAGENVAKGIEERQRIKQNKRQLLEKFGMKELKGICQFYGIKEPSPFRHDIFDGKKYKVDVTRDDYIDKIVKNLEADQIENYAQRYRIPLPELEKPVEPLVIQERTELEEESQVLTQETLNADEEKLKMIIKVIQEFQPRKVFEKESEYENTLAVRLETFFPEVETQVPYANSRIDIKIGKFGIEVKNHPDQNEINRLIGQLISFKRFFIHVIIVIFNPRDAQITSYLKKQLKELGLAATVIVK